MDIQKIALRLSSLDESEVIPLLMSLHQQRYEMDIALRNHSDRLRGPWRDALVEHWYEHAEEQRSMAYDLAMKLVSMGQDPVLSNLTRYGSDASLTSMLTELKQRLESMIKMGEVILSMNPSSGVRIMVENHIVTDNQHLDDIVRMTP